MREMDLDAPFDDGVGGSLRKQAAVLRTNGRPVPPDMESLPMPVEFEHVKKWFDELDRARGSNGFAVNPISWCEIDAWCRRTRRSPTSFELDIIRDLDLCAQAHFASRIKKKATKK